MKQLIKSTLAIFSLAMTLTAAPFYGNILFDKGSASLSADAEKKLTSLIATLDAETLNKSNESIVITGFIDQSSDESLDTLLAQRRAETVAAFIRKAKNISADRIAIRGTAAHNYHILTVTTEGRRLNRRAEIVVKRMQKKEIPLVLNVVETEQCTFSNKSTTQLQQGDSILVGESGFARLSYGTGTSIDLDRNTLITIADKKIVVLNGAIQINRRSSDEVAPQFTSLKSSIIINGNGAIQLEKRSSLFVSVFSGTGAVQSPFGKKACNSMEGIAVLNGSSTIVTTKLPSAPKIASADTIALIPGTSTAINWNKSGETFRYMLSTSPSFSTNLKEVVTADTNIQFASVPGVWYYKIQAENAPGFRSLWSSVDSVLVTKKEAVTLADPFKDTLFAVSPNRPFTLVGIADPVVKLFLDSTAISTNERGEFSHKFMLKDDRNALALVTINPDNSKDTLEAIVLYTGADEIIDMNDSIMGREAFTTSRHYKFRGTIPNAVSLKINGESIKLNQDKAFEKKLKLPGYESVERIQHDTPIQQLFFALLGLGATATLFVFMGLQSAE